MNLGWIRGRLDYDTLGTCQDDNGMEQDMIMALTLTITHDAILATSHSLIDKASHDVGG